jgi:inner membrane protein involved in colicin E2 resistance
MIVPPSDFLDGLLSVWPYLLGGVGIALAVGFAVPIRKKRETETSVKTIIREEVDRDVKIVTRVHKEDVVIPYDVWLKLVSDYEKVKQDAMKSVLTQLALLEAKKEEEIEARLKELVNTDTVYKDLVKVKRTDDSKRKKEEDEGEEVDVDTSELYRA